MYIRMTEGRDRGEVKDFSFDDAQALIKAGHAEAVNFADSDPLAKRNDVEEVRSLPLSVPPQILGAPPVMTSVPPANAHKTRKR